MFILRSRRWTVQWLAGTALLCAVAAVATAEEKAVNKGDQYTDTPSVKWLLKPFEVPGAAAQTEGEMKPYTEALPGAEIKFDMVPIKGGTFQMGSPESEKGRNKDDEGPQVEVKLDPFWMGKYEVTWEEYETWSFELDKQRRKVQQVQPTAWDDIADIIARPTKPYTDMTFGMGKQRRPAVCMTSSMRRRCTASGSRPRRVATTACRPRRNGSMPAAPGRRRPTRSATIPRSSANTPCLPTTATTSTGRLARRSPTRGACTTCTATWPSWCLDQYVPDAYAKAGAKELVNPFIMPTKEYPHAVAGWVVDGRSADAPQRGPAGLEQGLEDAGPADSAEHLVLHRCDVCRLPRGAAVADADRRRGEALRAGSRRFAMEYRKSPRGQAVEDCEIGARQRRAPVFL